MYTLMKSLSLRGLLTDQLPSLSGALLIAELFYKFHSFTLECFAFLATWFVLDALVQWATGKWVKSIGKGREMRTD